MPEQNPTAPHRDGRIPATVVTGFLGAGKTTFLNYVLRNQADKKLAVIVNEFGEISIDGQLVVQHGDEQIVEFNNGCLCCTVRGDLVDMLGRLRTRGDLDGILIETTGLADPAPVASTFFVSDEVKKAIRLDSFITLVDAVNIGTNLEQSNEAQEQIAFSDIILINKTDLVDATGIAAVERRLRRLNPLATMYHTKNGEIEIARVLDVDAFDLEAKLQVDPQFLGDHEHEHDASVSSFVLTEKRPIDINRFMLWMGDFAAKRGNDLLRTKGIFYANGFRERLVFQSVRMLTTLKPERLWRDGEEKSSIYVVIGRDLDKQEFVEGFERCVMSPGR
jgi:G3E family GTPase